MRLFLISSLEKCQFNGTRKLIDSPFRSELYNGSGLKRSCYKTETNYGSDLSHHDPKSEPTTTMPLDKNDLEEGVYSDVKCATYHV